MSSTIPTRNRDVMNNHYAMIDGMHTVAEAIEVAVSKKVNILVVNKRNEHDEYGMVLMSDIARKVLARDKSPERTNIYEIMIKPVFAVSADMDVRYTARLFERFNINKAPVIESGNILGFVAYDDIVLKGMFNP
ncbi:CBS domain-containing protein [Shewanella sp. SR43-4]|jgi:predicted transcriptional regulator|uniref:CBS domain-containing protein n=1 Tax=Shewanella vesiculosa TaxID=518738 RepID=A0ABV0FPI3_9GAMM|nr:MULTISPECIES: CBS domain-containing protein [Shewanella]NCQ43649.1 CBS domain-containing protein [Shewanella frigidimarina]MBB1316860.1 CBS domain-containing protein [Shewanella sp. SR43-4]MBB1388440.1 CBS domain-containing protein [Shewanella sp. SG44-6]MBB1476697.1 CBS domain-containing protein [Shewanella sp. SG41-3]NCO70023.1 CBS domain-containing protein [Shewanella vesiculosa]|tara:strand:- start:676 stop:1077 length:402 start_codon:yes stop_codon:yes gene_type:complete